MTATFDRLLSSAPVNATAARVIEKGVEWTPTATIQDWYADQPPTIRWNHQNAPEAKDFTGLKIGQLLIIGVMPKASKHGKASWVCRCVCGCFCTRTSKSLKVGLAGGNSFVPVCGRCDYQQRLRGGWTPNLKNRPEFKA